MNVLRLCMHNSWRLRDGFSLGGTERVLKLCMQTEWIYTANGDRSRCNALNVFAPSPGKTELIAIVL